MIDFEALRQQHSLTEVARRSGYTVPDSGDVMVSCPMPGHDDSTPSMNLHLDTDRYYCFGCSAGGDVVQWVKDIYGVTVKEAVRILEQPTPFPPLPTSPADQQPTAGRAVRAERPDPDRTPTARLLAALQAAWNYYTYGALHVAALEYLTGRGIHVLPFEAENGGPVVGHTPFKAADQATLHLMGRGFTLDELVDAGITQRAEHRQPVDAYRHRIVVPVRDDHGHVIGLIGRYTGDRADTPKYMNPGRTAVYDKSRDLYRPSVAPLARHAQVIVVEGTLDALAVAARAASDGLSDQYAPVTSSGTRLSGGQVATIAAIHPRPVVIAADGDPTGLEAATRWATAFTLAGRETVITSWPGDLKDPAVWLAAHPGPDGLAAVTRHGCLEADPAEIRPRHSAPVVVPELRRLASPDAAVRAVLSPLSLLHCPGVAERWGPAIGHELAAIAATTDPPHPERIVAQIAAWTAPIAQIATWTAQLPADTRRALIPAAARTLAEADYGPDGYLERKLAAAFEATHPKAGPDLDDRNRLAAQRTANTLDYNRPGRY